MELVIGRTGGIPVRLQKWSKGRTHSGPQVVRMRTPPEDLSSRRWNMLHGKETVGVTISKPGPRRDFTTLDTFHITDLL